ncbi:MAG: saccharopine dehydrogenase C-terminal domain-containing protein [Candidatus Zixiibacteriota bacterium]
MNILVLGAGLMAQGAVYDYLQNPDVSSITVADNSADALSRMRTRFPDSRLRIATFDAHDEDDVRALMKDADGVLCAVHYGFNLAFTRAAIATRTHLVDLGGNNDVVASQLALNAEAERAGVIVTPDCGLAPGMVAVLVKWGVERFPWVDTVRIRVGGLPRDPKPPFAYERLFSVEGLINEYVEPPIRLENGKIVTAEPLGDLETVEFAQPAGTLEAFNTSGGVSTLPDTFGKRLRNLDYKTLRYPGHAHAMQWLYHLGLFSSEPIAVGNVTVVPRQLTARAILDKVPEGKRDMTVVRIEFAGAEDGQERLHRLDIIDTYNDEQQLTSMMRMTAFPAAIVSQMQCDGRITARGVVPQERCVDADAFVRELVKRKISVSGLD